MFVSFSLYLFTIVSLYLCMSTYYPFISLCISNYENQGGQRLILALIAAAAKIGCKEKPLKKNLKNLTMYFSKLCSFFENVFVKSLIFEQIKFEHI